MCADSEVSAKSNGSEKTAPKSPEMALAPMMPIFAQRIN